MFISRYSWKQVVSCCFTVQNYNRCNRVETIWNQFIII